MSEGVVCMKVLGSVFDLSRAVRGLICSFVLHCHGPLKNNGYVLYQMLPYTGSFVEEKRVIKGKVTAARERGKSGLQDKTLLNFLSVVLFSDSPEIEQPRAQKVTEMVGKFRLSSRKSC